MKSDKDRIAELEALVEELRTTISDISNKSWKAREDEWIPLRLSEEFKEVAQLLPCWLSTEVVSKVEFHSGDYLQKDVVKICPWGIGDTGACLEFSRADKNNKIKGAHCQLYVRKNQRLGWLVKNFLYEHWTEIAFELGCPESDLARQPMGCAYPIKQHNIDDSSPAAIAKAFGIFCSVIYRWVNPIIQSEMG